MTGVRIWSKEWLKYIDRKKLALFPLQLANCDRLEKNKAVYIFDEVGSGKTISAGLMALHYLYNNGNARVLVITTPQLADIGDTTGPFKKIWLDKLPFNRWMMERQIKVINYDYRNIKKVNGCNFWELNSRGNNWDLVIIDEAHMFLRSETKRREKLTGDGADGLGRIFAQKIVFLTATPIKNALSDLQTYSEIARKVTHPSNAQLNSPSYQCFSGVLQHDGAAAVLAPAAGSGQISPENLICSTFDPSCPFTRYFTDTIRELRLSSEEEQPPKRTLAKVWECNRENRQEVVLNEINQLYRVDSRKNRFLIFVRWVEKNWNDPGCSAEELETYFISHGFIKYSEAGPKEKSVEVVTGTNGKLLSRYSDTDPDHLPTVLITTYSIGEQGVNLPGYNHVINYHIPASPASLEQRFGRIDRLDSKAKEISVFYPLLESFYDSSTHNFYYAVSTYIKRQLPALPARNSILTGGILDLFEKGQERIQVLAAEIREIRNQWKSDKRWARVLEYLDGVNGQTMAAKTDLSADEGKMAEFILGDEETIEMGGSKSERIDRIKKICERRLKKLDFAANTPKFFIELAKEIIYNSSGSALDDEVGNNIFYVKSRADAASDALTRDEIMGALATIRPVGDNGCAGFIRKSPSYTDYKRELDLLLSSLTKAEEKQ